MVPAAIAMSLLPSGPQDRCRHGLLSRLPGREAVGVDDLDAAADTANGLHVLGGTTRAVAGLAIPQCNDLVGVRERLGERYHALIAERIAAAVLLWQHDLALARRQ